MIFGMIKSPLIQFHMISY